MIYQVVIISSFEGFFIVCMCLYCDGKGNSCHLLKIATYCIKR